MLKFQANKGTISAQTFKSCLIRKRSAAIALTAFSDGFRDLRGAQRVSGVLRLRRFRFGKRRQFRKETFRPDAVAAAQKRGQMISSPDTPAGAAAFHPFPNQGEESRYRDSNPLPILQRLFFKQGLKKVMTNGGYTGENFAETVKFSENRSLPKKLDGGRTPLNPTVPATSMADFGYCNL